MCFTIIPWQLPSFLRGIICPFLPVSKASIISSIISPKHFQDLMPSTFTTLLLLNFFYHNITTRNSMFSSCPPSTRHPCASWPCPIGMGSAATLKWASGSAADQVPWYSELVLWRKISQPSSDERLLSGLRAMYLRPTAICPDCRPCGVFGNCAGWLLQDEATKWRTHWEY